MLAKSKACRNFAALPPENIIHVPAVKMRFPMDILPDFDFSNYLHFNMLHTLFHNTRQVPMNFLSTEVLESQSIKHWGISTSKHDSYTINLGYLALFDTTSICIRSSLSLSLCSSQSRVPWITIDIKLFFRSSSGLKVNARWGSLYIYIKLLIHKCHQPLMKNTYIEIVWCQYLGAEVCLILLTPSLVFISITVAIFGHWL